MTDDDEGPKLTAAERRAYEKLCETRTDEEWEAIKAVYEEAKAFGLTFEEYVELLRRQGTA